MLAAAGATVLIALGIIGIPLVNACAPAGSGLVACLRDMADRKFDLPGERQRAAETEGVPAIDVPTVPAAPDKTIAPPVEVPPADVAPSANATTGEPALETEPTPGQGGPLLAPRTPDFASTPVPALPEPAPQVGRQAVLGEAAATQGVVPSAQTVHSSAPVPSVDAFVVAPLDNRPEAPASSLSPKSSAPVVPPLRPAGPLAPAVAPLDEPPARSDDIAALPDLTAATKSVVALEGATELAAAPPINAIVPGDALPAPPGGVATTLVPRDDWATPVVPIPPSIEPVAKAAVAAGRQTVAASDGPTASEPAASVAAPLILAPTIDAIELEDAASFVSGSGPAGAIVRLYSDGKLLGESPVEGGRWLIEAGEILNATSTELRVEAFEAETGKSLGESVITVEIERPESVPPTPSVEPAPAPVPEDAAPADPASEPHAEPDIVAPAPGEAEPVVTPPDVPSLEMEQPPDAAPAEPSNTPAAPPLSDSAPLAEPRSTTAGVAAGEPKIPATLPGLTPIVPDKTSASVEILPVPETEFTPLPPIGASEHEPATIELPAPARPALMAEFALPEPADRNSSVTVLRLFPFGDPVYGRFSGGQAIIRRGDTLWSLAHRYYGSGIHYRTIFKANREQIARPSRIYPGQVFDLPLVTE